MTATVILNKCIKKSHAVMSSSFIIVWVERKKNGKSYVYYEIPTLNRK